MRRRAGALLAAAFIIWGQGWAVARDGPTRPGKAGPTRGAAAKTNEPAPCPRGSWKDDPVCFGEGEKDALPTPSAKSGKGDSAATEPTIKPTANINPRPTGPGPYQAGVVYQSNGDAVTSNYGGGVSLQLPF